MMEGTDQEDDPVVAEIIEAALRPSIGRVSPEILDDMRLVLELFLTTHPDAVEVIDGLRPRASVSTSGDLVKDARAPGQLSSTGTSGRPR